MRDDSSPYSGLKHMGSMDPRTKLKDRLMMQLSPFDFAEDGEFDVMAVEDTDKIKTPRK